MNHKEARKILGVSDDASAEDIKKSYKKLAKKFHPDLNKGNKEYEEKFKEINVANDTLAKAEEPTLDLNDIFNENIFSSMFRRGNWSSSSNFVHMTHAVYIDPLSFINGGNIQINVMGNLANVVIERDTPVGTKVLLPNQGNNQIFIQLLPGNSERYTVSNNIHLNETHVISPFLAMLGGEIEVVKPDETKIKIKIPAGTQFGTIHRIRGGGLKVVQGQKGDLNIRVVITMPAITGSEEDIMAKITKEIQHTLKK